MSVSNLVANSCCQLANSSGVFPRNWSHKGAFRRARSISSFNVGSRGRFSSARPKAAPPKRAADTRKNWRRVTERLDGCIVKISLLTTATYLDRHAQSSRPRDETTNADLEVGDL